MRQRSKAQIDRDIADALRGGKRTSRSAHATKASARTDFIESYRALRQAFEQADEVVARVYNEAQRSGGDKKAMAKLKTVATRMDKAIQDYSGDTDELIAALE